MKLILKSMLMLSKEELCVLAEEIDFIYDICTYHQGEDNEEVSLKKDLEVNFKNLGKQILSISSEITILDKKISGFLNIRDEHLDDENSTKNFIEDERIILFFIDLYQKEINKIIQKLRLINGKTSQMFRDGYNQYIPKPTPGRMVSNINMTSQVEKSLTRRLGKILGLKGDDVELSSQIIWEYTKSYRITEYTKKEDDNDFNVAFFRMSYWYFDLPYLIPALTHEISHLALKDKENKRQVSEIIRNIKSEVIQQKKDVLFKSKIIKVTFFDNIIEEIIADIFSLIHHGTSYIFTMSHELLGYYFSSTFGYNDEVKSLTIAPWVYNDKRDNSFIRLSVIISFHNLLNQAQKNKIIECDEGLFSLDEVHLTEIQDLLDIIYCEKKLENNRSTIRNYYENWHNFLPEFNELEEFILFFIAQVNIELAKKEKWFFKIVENTNQDDTLECKSFSNDFMSILKNKNKRQKQQASNMDYEYTIKRNILGDVSIPCKVPKYYNDLWRMRFASLKYNYVPHKSELRKKIHRETIEKLLANGKLSIPSIKPYILTFYKYKIETGNRKPATIPYEATLGIYDKVTITEQDEFIVPKVGKIDLNCKVNQKYTLKFSMMKILNDIGEIKGRNYLNAVIQMEIDKKLDEVDTYKELTEKLNDLYDYFDKNQCLYEKVEFFKSLGPKDIIVSIKGMSIDSIYEIKGKLAKMFQRTFTTISYQTARDISTSLNPLENVKSCKEYKFSTEVRLSANGSFKISPKMTNKIEKCSMTPGVMDYRIEWKSGTSLSTIEEFYDEMIGKEIVSDIQTLFTKDVDCSDYI